MVHLSCSFPLGCLADAVYYCCWSMLVKILLYFYIHLIFFCSQVYVIHRPFALILYSSEGFCCFFFIFEAFTWYLALCYFNFGLWCDSLVVWNELFVEKVKHGHVPWYEMKNKRKEWEKKARYKREKNI